METMIEYEIDPWDFAEKIGFEASAQLQSTSDSREFRGRLVSAGRIRNAVDEPGHIEIPVETLQSAALAGQFDDIACFIDHAGPFDGSSLRNLFGVWHSTEFNPGSNSVEGTLRYYDTEANRAIANVFREITQAAAAGEPAPDVGVSIVFYPQWDQNDKKSELMKVKGFRKVESADLVFTPAADGRILEALSALSQPVPKEVPMPEELAIQQPPAEEQPAAPTPAPLSDELINAIAERAAAAATQAVESRIAKLVTDDVVQLDGPPPRSTLDPFSGMHQPADEVKQAIDWLFGVPGASVPEPMLRNSATLYQMITGDVHWRGIFDPKQALATATTSTLNDLAVDAINKVIVSVWDTLAAYRWYELVTTVQPNDGSLHNMQWIQFGGIGDLPVVAEGAAYTEATVADSLEADSFVKYGYYVGVTRKMLRNSQIAQIQAVPRALAISAMRTREAKIAGIFTTASGVGPTLDDDSVVLFHTASHSNLATTPFSYAAWSAARLECYKATEQGSSKRMGFWPKFWLGPADLYDSALEIFGYGAGPGGKPGTGDNNVNPFAEARIGDPRPIPIAVPSFTDANDWAYLVDPMVQPIIQMSYSQNPGGNTHPLPEIFSVVSETAGLMFSNDTMPIKVRDEYAYGVSNYRGIGKRNVT
jgi:hypothetical protein